MWYLVTVPLLWTWESEIEKVGFYPHPAQHYECVKTAKILNEDLRATTLFVQREFDCWHYTHPLLRSD